MRQLWRPPSARPAVQFAPLVDDGVRRAGFNPLAFANLEEYYNSKGTGVGNGLPIDPWVDLSGHAPIRNQVNASPGLTTSPTNSVGSSPNGSDQALFNGVDAETVSGTINPFPTGARGHSYFWGANFANSAVGALLWRTSLFNSCPREIIHQTTGTGLLQWRDSGGFHGTDVAPVGPHNLALLFDPVGVTGTFYIDGVATFSAAYTFGGNAPDTTQFSLLAIPLNFGMGYFAWFSDYYPQLVTIFDAFGAAGWGY